VGGARLRRPRGRRAGSEFVPDDPGEGHEAGDWRELQWNLNGPFGVGAPKAWDNLIRDGHPGGRGVVIAVLDTGVAYTNRGRFHRSPDFGRFQFVKGHDFINGGSFALDRNGHGTFVATPSPRTPTTATASPASPTAPASCP
jgi:serine protease